MDFLLFIMSQAKMWRTVTNGLVSTHFVSFSLLASTVVRASGPLLRFLTLRVLAPFVLMCGLMLAVIRPF